MIIISFGTAFQFDIPLNKVKSFSFSDLSDLNGIINDLRVILSFIYEILSVNNIIFTSLYFKNYP